MDQKTIVGLGVGLLIGWLLWRRRALAAVTAGVNAGGCCGGCADRGTAPGCPPPPIALPYVNYRQGNGPAPIRGF